MNFFAKAAIDDDLARLDALLDSQEARVRQAFAGFVRDATDPQLVRAAVDFLARGDVEAALGLLDSHIARLAAVLPAVYQNAATAEVGALAATLGTLAPTVALSFDPTDTPAAMQMRENTLRFIREFTDAQRLATRQALTTGLETGGGTQANARAFRASIGLTANQEAHVASYRRRLDLGSRDALDRALRDRRYDRSVERAAAGGAPLSRDQVDRMVARYRARYLAYRAETIARTETGRSISQAREEALRQNLAATGVADRFVDQTWRTTMDGRERTTHRLMNGQTVPLGQAFLSPSGALLRYPCDPRAPAAETVNCRCHRTFKINTQALSQAA